MMHITIGQKIGGWNEVSEISQCSWRVPSICTLPSSCTPEIIIFCFLAGFLHFHKACQFFFVWWVGADIVITQGEGPWMGALPELNSTQHCPSADDTLGGWVGGWVPYFGNAPHLQALPTTKVLRFKGF